MSEMNEVVASKESKPTTRNWVSFWSLFTLQTQNAFNDKIAQFLLIPLAAFLAVQAQSSGEEIGFIERNMTHVLGALMVLPFILFAPLAGWVSDRYSKTWVIRGTLGLQLIVLLLITSAVWLHSLSLAVFGFFFLSVESVLLSPAKKGITKELVGHSRLGFASGVLEMAVVLAVCAGQIISGWWYSARLNEGFGPWEAAQTPLLIVTLGAFLSIGVSMVVEKVPSMGKRPFTMSIFFEHFSQLKYVWNHREIRLCGVGISFFWGFAGFINLAAIQIGMDLSGGGGKDFANENSWLMLAASGGIALGGVIASLFCKRKIELGLVPLGGFIMIIGSLALGLGPIERTWVMFWLVIAGAGGAFLLVPLNAYLQDKCPPEARGKVLAGLNLLDCLAGMLAVIVQFMMFHWKVSYFVQFGFLAMTSLVATCYSAQLLPQQFARFIILSFFRLIYRVKVIHEDRMPKEGGVLLVGNHVSYIDALIFSAASPRPIQFLLFDEYFSHRLIGRVARFFGTIPISRSRAKEGVKIAAKALEEGNVVCIFPEGQLTRHGGMNRFMRGYEMIARQAKCPILPVAMDGIWGSIFSFEGNRFLFKMPRTLQYGVRVCFGPLIDAKKIKGESVRYEIDALRAEAFSLRPKLKHPSSVLKQKVKFPLGASEVFRERLEVNRQLPEACQRELLANAMQMGDMNAILRGDTVIVDEKALLELGCFDVIGIWLVHYLKLNVVFLDQLPKTQSSQAFSDEMSKHSIKACIGGAMLAEKWIEMSRELDEPSSYPPKCFDFSSDAVSRRDAWMQSLSDEEGIEATASLEKQTNDNGGLYPCYQQDGRVIAMSMPDPPRQTKINDPQNGSRIGTWGYVLPGCYFEPVEEKQDIPNAYKLHGPGVESKKIVITGMTLDSDGMLSQHVSS